MEESEVDKETLEEIMYGSCVFYWNEALTLFRRLKEALQKSEDGKWSTWLWRNALTFTIAAPSDEEHIGDAYSNRGRKLKRGANQVYEGKLGSAPFDGHGVQVRRLPILNDSNLTRYRL